MAAGMYRKSKRLARLEAEQKLIELGVDHHVIQSSSTKELEKLIAHLGKEARQDSESDNEEETTGDRNRATTTTRRGHGVEEEISEERWIRRAREESMHEEGRHRLRDAAGHDSRATQTDDDERHTIQRSLEEEAGLRAAQELQYEEELQAALAASRISANPLTPMETSSSRGKPHVTPDHRPVGLSSSLTGTIVVDRPRTMRDASTSARRSSSGATRVEAHLTRTDDSIPPSRRPTSSIVDEEIPRAASPAVYGSSVTHSNRVTPTAEWVARNAALVRRKPVPSAAPQPSLHTQDCPQLVQNFYAPVTIVVNGNHPLAQDVPNLDRRAEQPESTVQNGQSRATAGGRICPRCTFENNVSQACCEMCELDFSANWQSSEVQSQQSVSNNSTATVTSAPTQTVESQQVQSQNANSAVAAPAPVRPVPAFRVAPQVSAAPESIVSVAPSLSYAGPSLDDPPPVRPVRSPEPFMPPPSVGVRSSSSTLAVVGTRAPLIRAAQSRRSTPPPAAAPSSSISTHRSTPPYPVGPPSAASARVTGPPYPVGDTPSVAGPSRRACPPYPVTPPRRSILVTTAPQPSPKVSMGVNMRPRNAGSVAGPSGSKTTRHGPFGLDGAAPAVTPEPSNYEPVAVEDDNGQDAASITATVGSAPPPTHQMIQPGADTRDLELEGIPTGPGRSLQGLAGRFMRDIGRLDRYSIHLLPFERKKWKGKGKAIEE